MTDIKRKKLKIKNNFKEMKNIKSINLTIKRENNNTEGNTCCDFPFLDDGVLVDIMPSPMILMKRFFTDDEIRFLSGEYDLIEDSDALCEGLGINLDSEYTVEEINVKLSEKMRDILKKEKIQY